MANDVRIDVVTFTARFNVGSQDVVADLGGNTPKLVKFFISNSLADESIDASMQFGCGATDGTNEFSVSVNSRDNIATTEVGRIADDSYCINIIREDNLTNLRTASFTQWLSTTDTGDSTSGVRINWDVVSSGFLNKVIAVFYSGADYDGSVGTITLNGVGDTGDFDPGHATHLAEFYTHGATFDNLGGAFCFNSQGYGSFSGGSVSAQRCVVLAEVGAQANGRQFTQIRDDVVTGQINTSNGSMAWSASVNISSGTNIRLTTETGNAGGDQIGVISHNVDTLQTYVGTLTTPTSTGSFALTDPGFTPQWMSFLPSFHDTINDVGATTERGVSGHCSLSDSGDASIATSVEFDAATTNTSAVFSDKAAYVLDGAGTLAFDVTKTGFQSLGVDLNFATTDGTARLWAVAAIEAAGGDTVLTVADATHTQISDVVAFVQQNILTISDATHAQVSDNTAFIQQHTLTSADSNHSQSADNATFLITTEISADDATHSQAADATAFVQQHNLTVADANHDQLAGQATFVIGATLSPEDAGHDQIADASIFVQQNILALDDAQHGQSTDETTLITGETLSADDAVHAQVADTTSFTQQNTLEIQDSAHGHIATDSSFVQQHVFEPADAAHGQSAENVTLDTFTQLLPDDTAHVQSADVVSFVQAHIFDVDDAQHDQTADNVSLSEQQTLVVEDSQHAQNADNASVLPDVLIAADDSLHGQIAVSTAFVQQHILPPADASHAQSADNIALSVEFTLSVDDAAHAQSALEASLVLGVPVLTGLGDRLMVIEREDRLMVVRD